MLGLTGSGMSISGNGSVNGDEVFERVINIKNCLCTLSPHAHDSVTVHGRSSMHVLCCDEQRDVGCRSGSIGLPSVAIGGVSVLLVRMT
jgi:hypothetical protein